MSGGKRPGHECITRNKHRVKDGTLCMQPSPTPGPIGVAGGTSLWPDARHAREVAGRWFDATTAWVGETGDSVLGHSKSLVLTLIDLLPLKQASPFSTALLKHYVERSGTPYELQDIPVDWQDWIVKTTGGRVGKHPELSPYNSGLFDLRNSLGHFDVEVNAGPGAKKTYLITDVYQFGFTKNDKTQKGRHGFPIGNPSGWQLEAAKKLLPATEYQNPGGFKEKWEIRTAGKETILLIPQQYLAEQGKPFSVSGSFQR